MQKQQQKTKNKNQQKVLNLFKKSNPSSVNNKSIYRQDYESLLEHNWLRTEAISSLITMLEIRFQATLDSLVRTELKQQSKSEEAIQNLKEKLSSYVKVIDPFIVTMILSTQQDFILQTLQSLNIFNPNTKYIIFPMNTDHGKGNHWFLTILNNPQYQSLINPTKPQQCQIFILNSILTSKQDTSIYMTNELSQQVIRLIDMFHPDAKKMEKIPLQRVENITHQANSYDCGIFTVAYIEEFLFKYVVGKEIEPIVKLGIWENKKDQGEWKYDERTLDAKCDFLLLKSSTFLRKQYRESLEQQIIAQNQSVLE